MAQLQTAAKIIHRPDNKNGSGHLPDAPEPDLFSNEDLFGVQKGQYLKKNRNRNLGDIEELIRNSRWDDIIALYHPAEEKIPELVKGKMDLVIREKTAFALGQTCRYDEAIQVLVFCINAEPDNFYTRSSLAYTAYNSLYAAKNRKIFLAGNAKSQRVQLAHDNFKKAQELRPGGVTNFYREAMLFSQIEGKNKPALPLFNTAIINWENLSEKEKEKRHQERKNYIKSLYRSASILLQDGNSVRALERIKKCLKQDEQSSHFSLNFKYFALGKVYFHMDEFEPARDALLFALQSSQQKNSIDFIYELLAKTYLALDRSDKALETIEKVPERMRRPYFRWTEADVLCRKGRFDAAKKALFSSAQTDQRSKHKSLIRLAKIDYSLNEFDSAMKHAENAGKFFRGKWGNTYFEGTFWQALCAFKAGHLEKSRELLETLETECRFFPKLDRLSAMIRGS